MAFAFFHDAALTQPITGGNPLSMTQYSDGSAPPADRVIYLGSTASAGSKQLRDAASPGAAQLVATVVDAAGGSGSPASDVKLALSLGGLTGATGGAPLNLGTAVLSGVSNALPIYLRLTDSTLTEATNTDLSIVVAGALESVAP